VLILGFATNAGAARIDVGEESFLNLSGFIQTQMLMDFDPSNESLDQTYDFYLKRVRFIASGQLSEKVRFLLGTLTAGYGAGGDYSARTWIADAWLELVLSKKVTLDIGQLKLCFSRHMQQTSALLHGIDFHGSYIAYPGNKTHRDLGVMFRGLVSDNKVDYRFAIVDGLEPSAENPRDNDLPRIVGRVGYNVFDSEPGYFWGGTYLGQKKILSFGASFDFQPAMHGEEFDEAYSAFALDMLADIPLEENGLNAAASFYYFGEGGALPEGSGAWAELGYRIDKIEPLIGIEIYEPEEGDMGKREVVLVGLNYWFKGHATNFKIQFASEKLNNAEDASNKVLAQAQVKF
jgi:hypothetical protein